MYAFILGLFKDEPLQAEKGVDYLAYVEMQEAMLLI